MKITWTCTACFPALDEIRVGVSLIGQTCSRSTCVAIRVETYDARGKQRTDQNAAKSGFFDFPALGFG